MSDIEKYKTQLQQVESILSNDPNNAQFLKIQADLKKLIELTTGSTPNNGSDISGTNDDENDDLDRLYDKENPTLIEDVTPSDTGSFENTSEMKHDFKIGDNIGITSSGSNGRPYSGIITAISPESNTCSVQYYEFIDKSGEVILPVSQLYHLSTLINIERAVMSPQDIEVGGVYQCKYSADQQYYNATVDEVYHHKGLPQTTDNTAYVVTYTEYLNKEVVPIEYIRRVPEDAGSVSASSGSNSTSIVNSAAHLLPQDEELLKIPESMKILPTDSEEVKLRKKKKIKAIKSKNRLIHKAQEQSAAQSSWQKFVKKGEKRNMPGIINSVSHTSTHASSGGMTSFAQRTKNNRYV